MATTRQHDAAGGSLWRELLSLSVYKRNQGRIARQATFAALAIAFGLGVWRLAQQLPVWFGGTAGQLMTDGSATLPASADDLGVVRFLVPGLILGLGLWVCYRVVNVPRFADFLIAVESEMTKVSWPSKDEVIRSSAVVIFLIFALAAILAGYDLFWWFLLRSLQGLN